MLSIIIFAWVYIIRQILSSISLDIGDQSHKALYWNGPWNDLSTLSIRSLAKSAKAYFNIRHTFYAAKNYQCSCIRWEVTVTLRRCSCQFSGR